MSSQPNVLPYGPPAASDERTQHDAETHDTPGDSSGKRVLVVAPQPFFTERGTPIAVRLLVEEIARLGYAVDLLTFPFGDDVSMPGVTVYRCARIPGVRSVGIGFSFRKVLMDLMLSVRLFTLARPGRYAVVHAVEEALFPAVWLRGRHDARVVYDMDSHLTQQLLANRFRWLRRFRRVFQAIEYRAIRACDAVVAVSEDLAAVARHAGGAGEVHVLPDTPQPDSETGSAGVEDLRRTLDVKGLLALYVGNLEPYQGIDLLVESCARLPAGVDVTLVAVGGDPRDIARYQAKAEALGVDERVRFVGPRPLAQLNALLAQADILLSPRISGNNTPMKIYSYMNAGRVILATRLATHTQVLDDTTACLSEPQADAFAAALRTLVEQSATRERLAMAALQHVREHYSQDAFRLKLGALYGPQGLLQRDRVAAPGAP